MLLVGNFRGQANHALDKQEILRLDKGEVVPLLATVLVHHLSRPALRVRSC